MPAATPTKHSRSEQARINGSKSRGPKTPHGKLRARTATDTTLQSTIDPSQYALLRAQYHSAWAPANSYIADKVDDLVAARWEINRLREVRRQFLNRVYADIASTYNPITSDLSVIAETEVRASTDANTLDRLDLRLRRVTLDISRIERDIARVNRYFSTTEGSQMSLITNEQDPEEPQETSAEWARRTWNMDPTAQQTDILNTASHTTVLAAGPQSGKTTALALRALHEVAHHPAAVVACLGPSGDLLKKIEELASIVPSNITGTLTAAATLVLIDDAASLSAPPNVPPHARLILAGAPGTAASYFYEQWMNPHAAKVF